MILAVDVGNTNITCGVFRGEEIVASFRITTKMPKTSDEYGMMLGALLEKNQVNEKEIRDAIIASAVPNVMHFLQNAIIKYLGITPIVVEAEIKTGIRVATPTPQQIGADRIVDAVAAYELYGGPVLVIDFGTALTFSTVSKDGDVLGVAIAPGLVTAVNALFGSTAQLPQVELKVPSSVLGRDSMESIRAGIMEGYSGLVEKIIANTEKELGERLYVMATGGLSSTISTLIDRLDELDPILTLKGLGLIADLN